MVFLFQTFPEPPTDSPYSFLIWAVGILVAALGFVGGLYVKGNQRINAITEQRVTDRDKQIAELRKELAEIREDKEKLISELKASFEASNSIAKTVMDLIRKNEK